MDAFNLSLFAATVSFKVNLFGLSKSSKNIHITENDGHKLEICKLLQPRETNLFVTKPSPQCISNDTLNN